MIPIFVISLPDCTDRRTTISGRLDGLSLPFEFVEAIDGRGGLAPEHKAMFDPAAMLRAGKLPLNDAEAACALSHIKVYRKISDLKPPHAVILEDDAIVSPDIVIYLKRAFYRRADLAQLGYNRTWVDARSGYSLFGDYRSFPWKTRASGAFGYAISLRLAEYWSEAALPIVSEADWPEWEKTFSWEVIYPKLVSHPEGGKGQSTISQHSPRARRKPYLHKIGIHPKAWLRAWFKLRHTKLS